MGLTSRMPQFPPSLFFFFQPLKCLSLSLSLAFSHPPTKNYAPVITTIYQVPTLCQVQSYAISDLHDNPVRSAFSAHGTKKEIESVGLGTCLHGGAGSGGGQACVALPTHKGQHCLSPPERGRGFFPTSPLLQGKCCALI